MIGKKSLMLLVVVIILSMSFVVGDCGDYESYVVNGKSYCYNSCTASNEGTHCSGNSKCYDGECSCGGYETSSSGTCYTSCTTNGFCVDGYECANSKCLELCDKGYVRDTKDVCNTNCGSDGDCDVDSDFYCDLDSSICLKDCGAYKAGYLGSNTRCFTDCQDHEQCADGYMCSSYSCITLQSYNLLTCDETECNNLGYICNAQTLSCYTSCTTSSECATGFACGVSHSCISLSSIGPTAAVRGTSTTTCVVDSDCADTYTCDSINKVCVEYCKITECNDGIDNDGYGGIDYYGVCVNNTGSLSCLDPSLGDGEPTECDDLCPDDYSGTYIAGDSECRSPYDNNESSNPQCADGINNDGDFSMEGWEVGSIVDYPYDSDCSSPEDDSEGTPMAAAPELTFWDWFKDVLTFWN